MGDNVPDALGPLLVRAPVFASLPAPDRARVAGMAARRRFPRRTLIAMNGREATPRRGR